MIMKLWKCYEIQISVSMNQAFLDSSDAHHLYIVHDSCHATMVEVTDYSIQRWYAPWPKIFTVRPFTGQVIRLLLKIASHEFVKTIPV